MSNVVKSVGSALGFGGESSTKNAGKASEAGVRQQIDYLRGAESRATARLSPFVELGTSNISPFQQLLTSEGQMGYLENNPIFQAAVNNSADQLKSSAAASGKFGSGGLVNQLFQNYLGQGENFISNQFNRLLAPIQIGQSAAAGSAANTLNTASQVGNAYSNIGDIQASTILGRQNASAALGSNLLQGAGAALGFFSDRQFKKNSVKVGQDEFGGIYEFDYIWGGRYRGRMADELRKIRPDAVVEVDGVLLVSDEFAPVKIEEAA